MPGLLAGLDEAGRGPLAGPVVAACVVLSPGFPVEILGDSKKLSERKRNMAETIIKEKCLWGVARVEHDEIDRINILNA
ncbi:MAG: ribonuclease HII, partial [Treponema sp.]|nr:ribonuclease HII [Treponema sp.]